MTGTAPHGFVAPLLGGDACHLCGHRWSFPVHHPDVDQAAELAELSRVAGAIGRGLADARRSTALLLGTVPPGTVPDVGPQGQEWRTGE